MKFWYKILSKICPKGFGRHCEFANLKGGQHLGVDGRVGRRRPQDPAAGEAAQGTDRLKEVAARRDADLEVARVRGFVSVRRVSITDSFRTSILILCKA
jgi:hypothetical protein